MNVLRVPLAISSRGWRVLRRMRTAIILLLVLAAGSAVGTLIPQRPVNEFAVARWKRDHAAYAELAERLGLFDVFGSAWFTAIYALLLVSLAGCLVPRYVAFLRTVRSRPGTNAGLSGLRNYRHGIARGTSDVALDRAERVLRRRRFRLVREGTTVAAEKGHLREGGSLVFHSSFFVLLIGVALSRGFGFSGQAAIIEGDRFTEAHIAYDSITEGRFFGERHRGFSVQVDDFDVAWHPNGVPKDFVSRVTVREDDRTVRRAAIRVNEPMDYRGVTFYQLAWGWAPRIQILKNGKLISDGNVVFLQDQRSQNWRGVVKVPAVKPEQLGLEMFFFTDLDLGPDDVPFNASPYPRRPIILFQEYRGDLGLTVPQSVFELDKTSLAPGQAGSIVMEGSARLADGIEIRFAGLKQYSVLQMTANPGAWVLFIAAVLILVGLVPALYSSRRRVWVRAAPDGDTVKIEVGGLALQRKDAFEEEFTRIAGELGRDLGIERPQAGAGSRVESGADAG